MKKIIFINSHPIQYFAPMYKYMNENGLKTAAWYASDDSIRGAMDEEFGIKIKWDIPLLEGYEYKFFKNYSWKPSISSGFFGLINLGMLKELSVIPKSVIVVHGWQFFTNFLILMLAKISGHTVCLRNDMPLSHEHYKKGFKQKIKKFGLKYILFPRIDYFLYIGTQNRLLFESYKINSKRLISCPYAVDNNRFAKVNHNTFEIRNKLGIPQDGKVILFTAKYLEKKRPMDLLHAFKKLNDPKAWLLMVGEGNLRSEMEDTIRNEQIKNVILTGFINQTEITKYYAIGDVFVMCSSLGENWGLSVNEAMNFNLPVVLSDLTGCADDLVIGGANGYVFETGNVNQLAERIKDVLTENKLTKSPASKDIIKNFSYSVVVSNLAKIV